MSESFENLKKSLEDVIEADKKDKDVPMKIVALIFAVIIFLLFAFAAFGFARTVGLPFKSVWNFLLSLYFLHRLYKFARTLKSLNK